MLRVCAVLTTCAEQLLVERLSAAYCSSGATVVCAANETAKEMKSKARLRVTGVN